MKASTAVPSAIPFDDVRGNRVCCSAKLLAKLEALVGGKGLNRQLVQLDEQIVGALPSDQRMMAKIQHVAFRFQQLCRVGAYRSLEFIDGFSLAGWRAARTVYSRE